MVLQNHVDGADTRFDTITGLLTNNPLGGWLGVIIRGTYQLEYKDSRRAYKPVSDLWTDINPDIYCRYDGSIDKGTKYHDNPYTQEQE